MIVQGSAIRDRHIRVLLAGKFQHLIPVLPLLDQVGHEVFLLAHSALLLLEALDLRRIDQLRRVPRNPSRNLGREEIGHTARILGCCMRKLAQPASLGDCGRQLVVELVVRALQACEG